MYVDISGIILSGGKSNRMGANKSLLQINGISIIERLSDLMKTVFQNNIIVTNEPELYQSLELPICRDVYIGRGPLAGIHSGLINSATDRNFIISCDIPLINADLIRSIVEYQSNKPIVVPEADGYVQQLCGVYSKSIIREIEIMFAFNTDDENRNEAQKIRNCNIHRLIDIVPTEIIADTEKLKGYFEGVFLNMNTPENYEEIKKIIMRN